MYHLGLGVPQDYAEALKWYRLAADQGDAWAQNNLEVMYDQGRGVPQDHQLAYMWLNLAARPGGFFFIPPAWPLLERHPNRSTVREDPN